MSKTRRRRNPFVVKARKGKHQVTVGAALTKRERKAAVKEALYLRKAIRGGEIGFGASAKKKLRALQKQIGSGKSHLGGLRKKARRFKKRGYQTSHSSVSFAEAHKIHTRKRRKKSGKKAAKSGKKFGYIGTNSKGEMMIRKKNGTVVTVKRKKGKKSSKKKTHKRRRKHAKKAAPKRKRRKHAKKAGSKKRRKHSRKHAKASAAPKRRRRKARRSRAGKRRHAKKYWAGRHHARHAHVGLGMKKGGKRRGTIRRGKKRYHYSVSRKNPQGGTMGKALDFITAGDPKEAGYILAAAALSEPAAALALQIPGLGSVLAQVNTTLAGINPNLAAAVVPILPTFLLALIAEFAGKKTGNKHVQGMGKGLMITNIVDFGEALGATLSSAAGLSGVSFTPMSAVPHGMGRKRHGMRGVSYTPMGAIPSMRGLTRHDNADFGRQMADFGGENLMTSAGMVSTAADFGGVDFTMGAVPRGFKGGSHTGDVQYPNPQTDSDGNTIDLDESNDHMT